MLVLSLPNVFVATHVNRAESVGFVMLKVDKNPIGEVVSRTVYLS